MDDESKKQFGGRLTDSEDFPDDFDREENDLNHYKAMSVINDLPIEIQTAIENDDAQFSSNIDELKTIK